MRRGAEILIRAASFTAGALAVFLLIGALATLIDWLTQA